MLHERLLELRNPNYPLIKKLRQKAPGTYYHGLLVGELAMQAAFRFKEADPLLTVVGGQLHDLGKISAPEFFAENQDENTFALQEEIILNHVEKGVKIARAFNLPEEVITIIASHHGNALAPSKEENKKNRYPGPRPRTVEETLVMLADSVEAAVRTRLVGKVDKKQIEEIILEVFYEKLMDEQLRESVLIKPDLDNIVDDFRDILYAIYHRRNLSD